MRFRLLVFVALLFLSRTASAQGSDPQVQTESEWYGPSVLIVYGVGYGVVGGAIVARQSDSVSVRGAGAVFRALGVGTVLFGVPLVHWGNNEVGRGFASLGGQVGAFGTGALVGYLVANEDHKGTGALVGGAIGHASFALCDAFFLAHHERVLSIETTTARFELVPYGLGGALRGSF